METEQLIGLYHTGFIVCQFFTGMTSGLCPGFQGDIPEKQDISLSFTARTADVTFIYLKVQDLRLAGS